MTTTPTRQTVDATANSAVPLTHTRTRSTSMKTLQVTENTPETDLGETATHDFYFLPIPKPLRHDPTKPVRFNLLLNVVFGLASTFREYLHISFKNFTVGLTGRLDA